MLITSLSVQPPPRKGLQEVSNTEEIWGGRIAEVAVLVRRGNNNPVPPHAGPPFLEGLRGVPSW